MVSKLLTHRRPPSPIRDDQCPGKARQGSVTADHSHQKAPIPVALPEAETQACNLQAGLGPRAILPLDQPPHWSWPINSWLPAWQICLQAAVPRSLSTCRWAPKSHPCGIMLSRVSLPRGSRALTLSPLPLVLSGLRHQLLTSLAPSCQLIHAFLLP